MKRLLLLTGVLALLASLTLSGVPTLAAGEPSITKAAATADFPASITFTLQAGSAARITDVRLSYHVERDSYARVVSEIIPDFAPGTAVTTSWTWDMRQSGGLPPGTVVDYWWTVRDASGKSTSSPLQQFTFADNRFTWKSIQQGNVTLYWYNGNNAFAQALMDAAQQGMVDLEAKTGATLSRPVKLYIYGSTADMQGAMIFPAEWTGGANYPDYGAIIIGIPTSQLAWGKRTVVHELTHQVTYQMTNNPYAGIPNWLSEGLSMYAEGPLEVFFQSYLVDALNDDAFISVRSLASPFSADSNQSYLSYAESYSLIDYLVATYGQAKMLALLDTFGQGSDYDAALEQVYGFNMDGLQTRWQDYAYRKYVDAAAGARA